MRVKSEDGDQLYEVDKRHLEMVFSPGYYFHKWSDGGFYVVYAWDKSRAIVVVDTGREPYDIGREISPCDDMRKVTPTLNGWE
jgi:hypothetical protein